MSNLRRQMINLQNEQAEEIKRWHYVAILVGIIGFTCGVLAHVIIGP